MHHSNVNVNITSSSLKPLKEYGTHETIDGQGNTTITSYIEVPKDKQFLARVCAQEPFPVLHDYQCCKYSDVPGYAAESLSVRMFLDGTEVIEDEDLITLDPLSKWSSPGCTIWFRNKLTGASNSTSQHTSMDFSANSAMPDVAARPSSFKITAEEMYEWESLIARFEYLNILDLADDFPNRPIPANVGRNIHQVDLDNGEDQTQEILTCVVHNHEKFPLSLQIQSQVNEADEMDVEYTLLNISDVEMDDPYSGMYKMSLSDRQYSDVWHKVAEYLVELGEAEQTTGEPMELEDESDPEPYNDSEPMFIDVSDDDVFMDNPFDGVYAIEDLLSGNMDVDGWDLMSTCTDTSLSSTSPVDRSSVNGTGNHLDVLRSFENILSISNMSETSRRSVMDLKNKYLCESCHYRSCYSYNYSDAAQVTFCIRRLHVAEQTLIEGPSYDMPGSGQSEWSASDTLWAYEEVPVGKTGPDKVLRQAKAHLVDTREIIFQFLYKTTEWLEGMGYIRGKEFQLTPVNRIVPKISLDKLNHLPGRARSRVMQRREMLRCGKLDITAFKRVTDEIELIMRQAAAMKISRKPTYIEGTPW
jgi:hypothetical protein